MQGVMPSNVLRLTSVPAAMSSRATSKWHLAVACSKGVPDSVDIGAGSNELPYQLNVPSPSRAVQRSGVTWVESAVDVGPCSQQGMKRLQAVAISGNIQRGISVTVDWR